MIKGAGTKKLAGVQDLAAKTATFCMLCAPQKLQDPSEEESVLANLLELGLAAADFSSLDLTVCAAVLRSANRLAITIKATKKMVDSN